MWLVIAHHRRAHRSPTHHHLTHHHRNSSSRENSWPTVVLENVNKVYDNGFHAIHDLNLEIQDKRVPRAGRPVRLRQVDRTADGRRPRDDHRWRDAHRRQARQRCRAQGSRHRDGVPELRPVPAHVGVRQHRVRAQAGQGPQGRDRPAGAQGRRGARAHHQPRSQARSALGRPASAGRDGSGDRAPAGRVPDGRAALQPRRQTARPDARSRSPRCSANSG